MNTYTSNGRKPVRAETIKEAAQILAARMAREEFGKRGDCRTCTVSAYSQDGSFAEFSAFIGITRGNETSGRNINFTVYSRDDGQIHGSPLTAVTPAEMRCVFISDWPRKGCYQCGEPKEAHT